jgi:CO dehydrogenase/acetyl-CoA synthase gamma subunit (corrinoid Fe-S protein)
MADDLKIDRIVARCTVSYKKDLKKIVKKVQTDVSGFTIAAINEKIKRDGLEDVK